MVCEAGRAARAKPIAEPGGAKRGRGMAAKRPPAPVRAPPGSRGCGPRERVLLRDYPAQRLGFVYAESCQGRRRQPPDLVHQRGAERLRREDPEHPAVPGATPITGVVRTAWDGADHGSAGAGPAEVTGIWPAEPDKLAACRCSAAVPMHPGPPVRPSPLAGDHPGQERSARTGCQRPRGCAQRGASSSISRSTSWIWDSQA